MRAVARAKIKLSDRTGTVLYSGEISGIEKRAAQSGRGEVFLPLEDSSAESVSVALSRAIGSLMLSSAVPPRAPLKAGEAASSPTRAARARHRLQ